MANCQSEDFKIKKAGTILPGNDAKLHCPRLAGRRRSGSVASASGGYRLVAGACERQLCGP